MARQLRPPVGTPEYDEYMKERAAKKKARAKAYHDRFHVSPEPKAWKDSPSFKARIRAQAVRMFREMIETEEWASKTEEAIFTHIAEKLQIVSATKFHKSWHLARKLVKGVYNYHAHKDAEAAVQAELERLSDLDAVVDNVLYGKGVKPGKRIAAAGEGRQISARRAAMIGIDAPKKIAPTNPEGDRPYENMTTEQLLEVARKLAEKGNGA